jgi:hypothetical protein
MDSTGGRKILVAVSAARLEQKNGNRLEGRFGEIRKYSEHENMKR